MNRRPGRSALIAVFAFVRLGAAAGPQAQPSRSLAATAPVLTIPAVASVRGVNGTSFRSDLWLLNRSHESAATVVLTYHVFTALGGGTFESTLTLEPRQSTLLEDFVATRLARPGSAGALEISLAQGAGPITAVSRVFSTTAAGTFGTSIPASAADAARTLAVFVGLSSSGRDLSRGFRSNAGAYNPNAEPAQVTFELYADDGDALGSTSITLAGHEAAQLFPDLFALAGAGARAIRNAVLVVRATKPLHAYAIVIDNATGDSVYLPPDSDEADIAGVWGGTFNPANYLDCPAELPARATFQRNGRAVAGLLTAAGDCGFSDAAFEGTIDGNVLFGTVKGGGFSDLYRATLSGAWTGASLDLDIYVDCPGVLCIPGGAMKLRR